MQKLIVTSILCFVLLCVSFAHSAAQTITPTPDLDLTATQIIRMATATAKGIDSPTPVEGLEQTLTVAHSTRTAIALTRDPSLAISPTPNPIQLTATRIEMDFVLAQIAEYTTATETPLTPADSVTLRECQSWIENYYRQELSSRMKSALEEIGVQVWDAAVVTIGVHEPMSCGGQFYPLQTFVVLLIEMKDMIDNSDLADQTVLLLSVLKNFPPTDDFGPQQTHLQITFTGDNGSQNIVTGYSNALAAYDEGLRGAALLEALGGILPG